MKPLKPIHRVAFTLFCNSMKNGFDQELVEEHNFIQAF